MWKGAKQFQGDPARREPSGRSFSCLPEMLGYHARTAPSRTAILAPGHPQLTYGALWASTKSVVHRLRRMGVSRTDRVAVVLPDGPEAAFAMVAVASGAVCVPLHPGFTINEYQRYFSELRISALVTSAKVSSVSQGLAKSIGIPIIDLSERFGSSEIACAARQRVANVELASRTDDAFILLTSGSTSRPKMVPLTHANVCLSAYNVSAAINLVSQDRLLHVLPLVHGHGLISGLVSSLAAGASVVCMGGFNTEAFFDCLNEYRPTWYTAVPAIHRAVWLAAAGRKLDRAHCPLRLIRSASSTLPSALLHGLEATFGVPVIDTYGMTEAATQIAANPIRQRKLASVGRSAGAEIAIWDEKGSKLPFGSRGEIVLRGPTITRGYENDAESTESAFRDGWFRTGDLGYLDSGGYLFIVGRIKDIIDRGGQKISPAEVEEALLSHPDVIEAVVFAIPHTRLGADVAAAVVLRPGGKLSPQQLRSFARERLAGFKIPGRIQIVPKIPKAPHGKIRRSELPALLSLTEPRQARRSTKKRAPGSELERQLAKMWSTLLELKQVDADQDVFALGADSIIIMQALSRLRADFGVAFSLKDIFDAPSVAALAARIELAARTPSPRNLDTPNSMERMKRDVPQRASIFQDQVLRIERAVPGLPQFNRLAAYRLRGRLNVSALKQSLAEVIGRHDALHTHFNRRGKLSVARFAKNSGRRSFFAFEDLTARSKPQRGRGKALLLRKAKLKADREAVTAFDLGSAPLLRARLLRLDTADHVLLLTVHEIAADGWSMGIIMDEVSALYTALATRRAARLPLPPIQFSDFARWQHQRTESDAAAVDVIYWKGRLQGASPVFSTNGVLNGASLSTEGIQEPIRLPKDLTARLHALSHSQSATIFMTLMAGFKALLMIRSGHSDLCIATTMANRSQPQTEGVIGPFTNTVLIRTRLGPDLSFKEALRRVRESILGAYSKQELPFATLMARLAEEELDVAGFTQVFFGFQNPLRRRLKLHSVTVRPFVHEQSLTMRLDPTLFAVTLGESPSGITGLSICKGASPAPDIMRHWTAAYNAILTKAAADPEAALGRLTE